MKRKILSVFFALVLVLSFSLVTAVPVAAAGILNVPGDHNTIQDAIDAAGPDYIINVAAGTYVEDLEIPDTHDGLVMVGADGAIIKGVSLSEWNVTTLPNINILAEGVSVSGFTIQGPEPSGTLFAAGMIIGAPNVEIYDNDFEVNNPGAAGGDDIGQAIVTWNQLAKPGTDISGLSIHNNTFTSNGVGEYGYEGIYINRDVGVGPISITGNDFSGAIIRAITTERSNTIISGNSIVATAGLAWTGVLVMDIGSSLDISDIDIASNLIEGFNDGVKMGDSGGTHVLTNISITGNTLQGNGTGIRVRSSADGEGVGIHNNSIAGNTNGVINTDDATLDAISNWWGSINGPSGAGPGTGDTVSTAVDYDPWLGQYGAPVVTMTASYTPPAIGISVTPTTVNFGAVTPDTPSSSTPVTVTNTGDVAEVITASLSGISTPDVYTTGLTIDGSLVGVWGVTPVVTVAIGGDTGLLPLILTVPLGTLPGTYGATLIFWAEATP